MRLATASVLGFALVLLSATAFARTIVVAQDGSGEHRTIADAIGVARTGDTVLVKAGIYRETVKMDAEGVVLEGRGAVIDGGGSDGVWPSSGSTVRGFVIRGCDDAIFVTSERHGVVIEHNTILLNGGEAVTLMYNLRDITLRHNILWSNTDGIFNQGENSVDAHHNLVFGNKDNDYYNIEPGQGDLQVAPGLFNPDRGDYRLRPDSPARRAGQGGADLGAFFDGEAAPKVAEAIPTPAPPDPGTPKVSLEILFVDASGDGRLAAGEEGAVTLTLRNRGISPIGGGSSFSVRAELLYPKKGVKLYTEQSYIGEIGPGRDAAVSFPVSAADDLKAGKKPLALRLSPAILGAGPLPSVVVEVPLAK